MCQSAGVRERRGHPSGVGTLARRPGTQHNACGTSTFSSVAGVQQGVGRSETSGTSGPLSEDLKTKLRSCPEGAGKKPGHMMSWKAFLCSML